MSTSNASAPVKRACDSCHRRKVKCIGEGTNPCRNCVSAGLACTYNAIPQKKGPKGSRAKVLSELREHQRLQQTVGLTSELGFDVRGHAAAFARTPGLLPPGLLENCVDFFFSNVYPSQPVLHRQRAQEIILSIEQSNEAYCMLVALCAYVMIQANMTIPHNLLPRPEMAQLSNVSIGHVLLEESVRVRKGLDYLEHPTHVSVLTSWFSYGCYFGLGRDNTAWALLREATTQAQLLGMSDEETYKNDPLDISRRRILFWLLFITERMHALHKHRPISLHATIHPPTLDESPSDRRAASGLDLLLNLYKPFDDDFFSLWNKVRSQTNPGWIAQIQSQLSEALPAYLECTETQAVDLRITQQWLRTMVWQLCVSQGMVSSVAADSAMTFKYPIEVSRDLLSMIHQVSQQTMEVHGVGLSFFAIPAIFSSLARPGLRTASRWFAEYRCICMQSWTWVWAKGGVLLFVLVLHATRYGPSFTSYSGINFNAPDIGLTHVQIEKLFDIACCLTDVVACIPFSPDTFALGPRDYVSRFLTLFSALRSGQTRYLPLLLAKISDVLPNLPLPRSLNIPQNLSSTLGLSHGFGASPSTVNEDLASASTVPSPSYPSTELIRQLAAQTGAQLPFASSQQSLLQAPTSRVEDLSLYDSTGPHSARSGSTPASQSTTPGPYEQSSAHSRAQLPPHTHALPSTSIPSSHPHSHGHMQSHHLGVSPTAYDPRFSIQGYPVDPSMMFKSEDADGTSQMQGHSGMYSQGANRGGLGHGRGHAGSGFAG